MKKEVTIPSHDGGQFKAYVSTPNTDLPAPAVVVIQEIFGVNASMRRICDNLAQAGYMAICPDLFWRQKPGVELDDCAEKEEDWREAMALFQNFDVNLGVADLKSTLAFIRKDARCTGAVGTVGYCLGGKLAFLMATRSDADCNVSYYGVDIENHLEEITSIKTPLLMHMAEKDRFVSPSAQEKIRAAVDRMPQIELHTYLGVDHAFARVGLPLYNEEAAHRADRRTANFLTSCLTKKS